MAHIPTVRITGDARILDRPKISVFCSVKCPGKLILDTYDLVKQFRDEGITVISGFHSPMEQECLRILLCGRDPVIWCLARGMLRRTPAKPIDCRPAVAEGRLLLVSPFPDNIRKVTTKTAVIRNHLVAEMANAVIVAHAAPHSKTESLCRALLATGKPLYTFDHPTNAVLINAGAHPITNETDWDAILSMTLQSPQAAYSHQGIAAYCD
jgi:predicted Rossmann fold nucleotide-binding protein DprA/Smf involved in DNA uptake